MTASLSGLRVLGRRGLIVAVTAMVLTSCGWRGIAAVPLDLGPGSQAGSETIYVQVADTLAPEYQQPGEGGRRVRRHSAEDRVEGLGPDADTARGTRRFATGQRNRQDRSEQPAGHSACRIGGSTGSVLGAFAQRCNHPTEPYVGVPDRRAHAGECCDGPAWRGIPNLEIIQNRVNDLLTGNADQIRAFLGKLDVFTAELNKQRDDIARAIESTGELFTYVSSRNTTIDRLLVDLPH